MTESGNMQSAPEGALGGGGRSGGVCQTEEGELLRSIVFLDWHARWYSQDHIKKDAKKKTPTISWYAVEKE